MAYDANNNYPDPGTGAVSSKSPVGIDSLHQKLLSFTETYLNNPTWRQFRKTAEKCFRYKEGDQLTAEEKEELEKRGQPKVVDNQIKPLLDRLIGQHRKQATRIIFRGRNYPQDDETAVILSDLARYVQERANYAQEEAPMFEDGSTCGFGVLWTSISFNEQGEPQIDISYEDELNVFFDPFSKHYDWNKDAGFVGRWRWVKLTDAIALYPNKTDILNDAVNDASKFPHSETFRALNYVDTDNKLVRLFEVWYKEKSTRRMAFPIEGKAVDVTGWKGRKLSAIEKDPAINIYSDPITQMKMAVFCVTGVLESKDSPYEHDLYPGIPFFVHRTKEGEPYSFVKMLLDLQDEVNKRRSKGLHQLMNNQTISEEGAIVDLDKHKQEKARPDGDITYRRGHKLEVVKNTDLAQAQMSFHDEAKRSIRENAGFNNDTRQEIRSNQQLMRQQMSNDLPAVVIFENLRRTRGILGKVIYGLIKQYFDKQMVFYITDSQQVAQRRELTQNHIQAIKEGNYDLIVEDIPDTATIQDEQFQVLLQFIQGMNLPPQAVMGLLPIFVRMSQIRNKDEIAQTIQQMGAPSPDKPKISVAITYDNLTPQERLALAYDMQNQMWIQAIQSAPPTPSNVMKSQEGIQKTQIKAQADIQKAQAGQADPEVEMAMKERDMQMKEREHIMKMQHSHEEHQMKMQQQQQQGEQKTFQEKQKHAMGMVQAAQNAAMQRHQMQQKPKKETQE